MAINKRWLVHKFDYVNKKLMYQNNPITGLKEPVYWDVADVNAFVDTEFGDDTTGNGTAAKPWKTLNKVAASGSNYWGTGKVIMLRGFNDSPFTINAAVRIVGAGGGICGRAVLANMNITVNNVYLDNLHIPSNGNNLFTPISNAITIYAYNCLWLIPRYNTAGYQTVNLYYYYCILYTPYSYTYYSSHSITYKVYGNNNTIYNAYGSASVIYWHFYGDNNHFSATVNQPYTSYGNKNLNSSAAALEYLSPSNYNFNFLNTSTSLLYRTGTYNADTDSYNHRGAGTEGINLNASNDELNEDEDATYTNLTKSGTEIYRTDIDSDGVLKSGIVDLGAIRTRVVMNLYHTYEYASGVVYRRIQESTLTDNALFDCIIKYGEEVTEIATCPKLLIEYGKMITVSGTGANRKGNADVDFNPDDMIAIDSLTMRYIYFELRFKSIIP